MERKFGLSLIILSLVFWNNEMKSENHSFRLFLKRLFRSTTTQRRSSHSADTVSKFDAAAPQATACEELAQGPYTWRLEQESNPRPFGRKATNLPNEPPCTPHK